MHVHLAIQEKGEPSISLVPRSFEMEVDLGSSSVLMCSRWIFAPLYLSCGGCCPCGYFVAILLIIFLRGDVGGDIPMMYLSLIHHLMVPDGYLVPIVVPIVVSYLSILVQPLSPPLM